MILGIICFMESGEHIVWLCLPFLERSAGFKFVVAHCRLQRRAPIPPSLWRHTVAKGDVPPYPPLYGGTLSPKAMCPHTPLSLGTTRDFTRLHEEPHVKNKRHHCVSYRESIPVWMRGFLAFSRFRLHGPQMIRRVACWR